MTKSEKIRRWEDRRAVEDAAADAVYMLKTAIGQKPKTAADRAFWCDKAIRHTRFAATQAFRVYPHLCDEDQTEELRRQFRNFKCAPRAEVGS